MPVWPNLTPVQLCQASVQEWIATCHKIATRYTSTPARQHVHYQPRQNRLSKSSNAPVCTAASFCAPT